MYYTLWEMKDLEKRGTDEVSDKHASAVTKNAHTLMLQVSSTISDSENTKLKIN